MEVNDLCINCFARKGKTAQCQKCGYVDGTPKVAPYLAPGTVLGERFVVGRHEKVTGEGVTYLGYDAATNERVIIREYLPLTLCTRKVSRDNVMINDGCELTYEDYKQDFIDVAKAVSRLSDIDVFTKIRSIFECNNTAYVVYDKPDGRPLGDIVKKAQRLTWDEARPLFLPLISAMNSAHAINLVHFGISPETVYFNRDKKLHITAFAIADSRLSDTPLKCELFDGYSAIEQYSSEGRSGKVTDIYALCALLFYTLTGKRPPEAVTRAYEPRLNMPAELAEEIPSHVFATLAAGLQVMPENRLQTMDELRNQLSHKPSAPLGVPVSGVRQSSRPVQQSTRQAASVGVQRAAQSSYSAEKAASAGNVEAQREGRGFSAPAAFGAFGKKMSSKLSAFSNLKQWQYLLISLVISIVVLGIIAIAVLSIFSPYLKKNSSSYVAPPEEYYAAPSETDTTPTYEVPNLVGQKWDDVCEEKAKYYNFNIYALAEEEASSEYDEGEIIRQDPKAGEMYPDGTVIQVVLSSGSNTVKVPKLVGCTISEATDKLTDSGLRLGSQEMEYSDEYAFGVIIEIVNVKAGDKVSVNSYINVKVSNGPAPTAQIVDNE